MIDDEDPPLPVYEPFSPTTISLAGSPPISRTNTASSNSHSIRRLPPIERTERTPSSSTSSQSLAHSAMEPHEGFSFTYTYTLMAGNSPVQVLILVESEAEKQNHYTFSLSIRIGYVERAISKPVTMRLSLDPRRLEFAVFAFPPRSSLPAGCLYNLRVWLRTSGIDHRLFSENDLWIGRDPDFRSIGDASFAILRNATQDMLIYQAIVGRAHVSFIVRWKLVEVGVYTLSLDYEAGGAGRTLFENYNLRLDCEPQTVSFLIYSIPASSTPPGSSHRLRVWLRSPHLPPRSIPSSSASPTSHANGYPTDSYLYQRLFKSDEFKLGAHLNFDALGPKAVMATREDVDGEHGGDIGNGCGNGSSVVNGNGVGSVSQARRRRRSRLTPILSGDGSGERVNDR